MNEESRKLKEEMRLAEAVSTLILTVSDDAIISIDENQCITMFNEGAERIFGYARKEIIGSTLDVLVPAPLREVHRNHIFAFMKSPEVSRKMGARTMDIMGLRKNGEEFCAEAAISKININGRTILTTALRDISERREIERRLREYNERLERSNQELDDFAYIVSHDLKEPLRGIHGYCRILEERCAGKLKADEKNLLKTVCMLTQRMENLIERLAEYSRVERVDQSFSYTDLNIILKDMLELIEPMVNEHHASVYVQPNFPLVECDAARISEVFSNLVTNALKYNNASHKTIEVGYKTDHAAYPGQMVFYVRDNGIGVCREHQKTIFKMFKRLHDRNEYGGGTGSGLAIAKKIIDRHGGKIWVEPNDGHGSVFYFTLADMKHDAAPLFNKKSGADFSHLQSIH